MKLGKVHLIYEFWTILLHHGLPIILPGICWESNEVYWWGGVGGKRAIGEAEFSRQHVVLWPVSEGRGRVRRQSCQSSEREEGTEGIVVMQFRSRSPSTTMIQGLYF